jgi:hypothetical protein
LNRAAKRGKLALMRYAVIVKPGAAAGDACDIYTLHANSVSAAAFAVTGLKGIPRTMEFLRHITVMPVSELPEGWDSGELGRGILTTDLDSALHAAPGF